MTKRVLTLLLLAISIFVPGISSAQGYAPDVAEFDGTTTLAFDPSPSLSLARGGTLEFWVVPDWEADPGFDPVIVSNAGPAGASYMVAMLRDRDGIGILSGNEQRIVAFDFANDQLHHVALTYLDGALAVIIDGQVRGSFEMTIADLPSLGFWVASADGETAPFAGAIASLRIWDVPLDRADLVNYAAQNVLSDRVAHPALSHLRAISDFRADELFLTDIEELN
jgi:hypothetical protein